jgi:hypothetical protein
MFGEIAALNDDGDNIEGGEIDDDDSDSVTKQNSSDRKGGSCRPETLKQVYRLKNEIPTRWNSCLVMMQSMLEMRKEVHNCIKMIGHYDKCLKGSEWAVVEDLAAYLSHFHDLTDLVSSKVTSLSLIQLMRREIDDASIISRLAQTVMTLLHIEARQAATAYTDAVTFATLLDSSTKD